MPRVASGTYATATISTSQTAAALAKSGAAAGVAGAFTVGTATPKRVSARLELTLEDVLAVGVDGYESSLRENIALRISPMSLTDQMVNGDGVPRRTWRACSAGSTIRPARPPATDRRLRRLRGAVRFGGIDGLWASTVKDIGVVVNSESYRLAVTDVPGSRDRHRAARRREPRRPELRGLRAWRSTGQFWTNKRMPDKASHIAQAILYRMGRSGMGASPGMRTSVCPRWGEVGIDGYFQRQRQGGNLLHVAHRVGRRDRDPAGCLRAGARLRVST